MPLHYVEYARSYTLGIWHITEDEACFQQALPLAAVPPVQAFTSHRRYRQCLASRCLLKQLNYPTEVSYTQDGKPYFEASELFLSISHSEDVAAVMIARQPTGLDIEQQNQRILKLQHKFVSQADFSAEDVESLTRLWSAKETMIKLLPGLGLEHLKDISIQHDQIQPESYLWGQVKGQDIKDAFRLCSRSFEIDAQKYTLVHPHF